MSYEKEEIKSLNKHIQNLNNQYTELSNKLSEANNNIDLLDSIIERVSNSSEYGMMETDLTRQIDWVIEKEFKVKPLPPIASPVKY